MARISAQEAHRIIADEQRQLNNGRTLPPTLERIRLLMRDETFSICNVGPWSYRPERAALSIFIPGYDPAKDAEKLGYAKSEPMPTGRREAKILDEKEFTWFEDDGRMVARDLIGVGFGLHPMNSLVQYGVFVPEGKDPTKEEIQTARLALAKYYDRLIEEARDAYDKGPEERKAVICDRHLLAARVRGLDEKWVHHQHTQESVQCKMCGSFNPAGIAKCKCGAIIDVDLFRRLQAEQDRMLEELTKPTKK